MSANFDTTDHVFTTRDKNQTNEFPQSSPDLSPTFSKPYFDSKPLARPQTAGASLNRTTSAPQFNTRNTASSAEVKLPRYVTTDKQVARFYGYFLQERPWERSGPLGNPAFERSIVRHMIILMHIFDGTVQINENKEVNSGLNQGTFYRRAKLMKVDNQPVTLEDLYPGATLDMLGRTFHITDADAFTRNYFLQEYGVELPPAVSLSATASVPPTTSEPLLRDLGAQYATGAGCFALTDKEYFFSRSTDYLVTKEILDKTNRFLQYDGQVLKFLCVVVGSPFPSYFPEFEAKLTDKGEPWEEQSNGYGFIVPNTAKRFVLSYYLSSREVDVVVERPKGTKDPGQDIQKVMLKRTRLHKDWRLAKKGINIDSYYEMDDLHCGQTIEVYGTHYLLLKCDPFAISSYARKGVLQREVTVLPDVIDPVVQSVPPQGDNTLPIGSAADTLATVYGMPKVHKDMIKVGRNTNRNIRCKAKLMTNDSINSTREFLMTFYLEDDTLQIYEEDRRNSGIKAGTFLKRGKYENESIDGNINNNNSHSNSNLWQNNSKQMSSQTITLASGLTYGNLPPPARWVQGKDMFLGNVLCVNGTTFQITEMDNVSLKFCESYPDEFPMFDLARILVDSMLFDKIVRQYRCDLRSLFSSADESKQHLLPRDTFLLVLDSLQLLQPLNDQELLTILRRFQEDYHRPSPYEAVKSTNKIPVIVSEASNEAVFYDEFVDFVSHLYFRDYLQHQHASRLASYKRNNVEIPKIDIVWLIARSRTTQWRRVFRRDPHSVQGKVTLATLIKIFARYQILLAPHTVEEIRQAYTFTTPNAKALKAITQVSSFTSSDMIWCDIT